MPTKYSKPLCNNESYSLHTMYNRKLPPAMIPTTYIFHSLTITAPYKLLEDIAPDCVCTW